MSILIGIDEAGLGPNLGPYVVTATVWELPDERAEIDLWAECAEILTSEPFDGDCRLHIGDSKAVYQPGKGIAALERGVLSALGMICQELPASDQELRRCLAADDRDVLGDGPWYAGESLRLPVATDAAEIQEIAGRWHGRLASSGIRLKSIKHRVLEPMPFNRLVEEHQNKAAALSLVSLQLLREAIRGSEDSPAFAWCDKHGGRNRYDQLLSACFDDAFVLRQRESAELSLYRIGKLEVRFLPRAESVLPVALASMFSKYVRELAMRRFNDFWAERIPGLKPTAGYPTDAKRFRAAISAEQARLRILDNQLWRCR